MVYLQLIYFMWPIFFPSETTGSTPFHSSLHSGAIVKEILLLLYFTSSIDDISAADAL